MLKVPEIEQKVKISFDFAVKSQNLEFWVVRWFAIYLDFVIGD